MAAPPAPAPRLFLALWPADGVREGLAGWRDRWCWPAGAAPTLTERLHLTLHFLGPVAADRVASLCIALREGVGVGEFTLEFGRAELWPGGIAVVCPLAMPAALSQLHERLALGLRALGLPVDERPFRPHVTLARRARQAVVPPDGPAVTWRVGNGFVLVESLRGSQGYQVLQRLG